MAFYSEFSNYYEHIFPFREPIYTFLAEQHLKDKAVLDIGCGIGHYAGAFGKNGHKAIGIDLDAEMIRVAKTKHPHPDFYVMNMMKIDKLQTDFGLIFSTGNVVAHLDIYQLENFVQTVYKKLVTGGRWVFQVLNFDFLLAQSSYTFPDINAADGRIVFHRDYPYVSSLGTPFQTELVDNGQTVFKDEVTLYPQLSQVYIEIHKAAGFHFIGQYSNFSKNAFEEQAMSANIFVFEKK